MVYTQNARGLWCCPQDPDGNILVDAPPDLSKLEYIIDYMRQQDVGAWLIQETWEEGDESNIESRGYHISITMLTKEQMVITTFSRVLQSSSPHYSTKHGDWQDPPLQSPWIQKMTLLDG
jgi:hypothetical protein